jgi:hypothetical protein
MQREDGPLLAGAQLDQPVVATYLDRAEEP